MKHMASVYQLPIGDPPGENGRARLPVTHGRRGDYALGDVARKLRIADRSIPTILATLRDLHEQERMPLPLNPRRFKGTIQRGAASIHKGSLWDAGRFDRWLEHRNPPSPADAAATSEALRRELAGNALRLAAEGRCSGSGE
jgi:hypothetical protein